MHGGETEAVVGEEVNEGLVLPNVIDTGPWSKDIAGQYCGGQLSCGKVKEYSGMRNTIENLTDGMLLVPHQTFLPPYPELLTEYGLCNTECHWLRALADAVRCSQGM